MIKKVLILSVFLYVFFIDFIISFVQIPSLKIISALFICISLLIFFSLHYSKLELKFYFYLSIFFLALYVFTFWPNFGYINLFYTIIFGWILAQNYNYTLKLLKIIFIIQFCLIFYESFNSTIIYDNVKSGVINENLYDYSKNFNLFSDTGFRPKGIFTGTLVATSFIIYMTMVMRNNLSMLSGLFILAFLTNGRLALLISGTTLFFKIFKKYDLILLKTKLSNFSKSLFIIPLVLLTIASFYFILPEFVFNNILNTFNLNSDSNVGRIFAYLQSINLFIEYDFFQKLFGSPGNIVYDVYGREIASESGFLSMALDIGFIGLLFYLYNFYKAWNLEQDSLFNLKSKHIGFKFVILLTFLSFIQYEHINGNVRGTLFWFIIISHFIEKKKTY